MQTTYRAKTRIQVRIGGRMMQWERGETIALDEEAIRQNLHPNDYEFLPETVDGRSQTVKSKKEKPPVSG